MDRKAIKAKAKEFAFSHKWAIWKPALVAGLIIGFVSGILSIVFKLNTFTISTGSLLFGLLLGSILRKDRFY